jgi:hypothetical protein
LITVWLCGIILYLFLIPDPFGIILLNVGLALGVLGLVRLSSRIRSNVLAVAYTVVRKK